MHTFRHTFISHAITQGVPEAIVREWVGHVDAVILKHYTHIHNLASQAAMQRLAEATDRVRVENEDAAREKAAKNGDGSSAQSQRTDQETDDEESAN